MASLGKTCFESAPKLVIPILIFGVFTAQSSVAQVVQEDNQSIQGLIESINENLNNSAIDRSSIEEMMSALDISLETSIEGLSVLEIEILSEQSALNLQIETIESSSSTIIQSLSPEYQQRLRQLEHTSGQVTEIKTELSSLVADLELRQKRINALAEINRIDTIFEEVTATIQEYSRATRQLNVLTESGLNVPVVLDCPGPGCPLGF